MTINLRMFQKEYLTYVTGTIHLNEEKTREDDVKECKNNFWAICLLDYKISRNKLLTVKI